MRTKQQRKADRILRSIARSNRRHKRGWVRLSVCRQKTVSWTGSLLPMQRWNDRHEIPSGRVNKGFIWFGFQFHIYTPRRSK